MRATANREVVERFYAAVGGDVVETLDAEEQMVELGELLSGSVADDFECVMAGPYESLRFEGMAGFAEAWRDWTLPYRSFAIDIEELHEVGENVVMMVRQRGVTRHDGVPIENQSGAVWRFRGGLLARVEFFLDRGDPRLAAELE